MPILELYEEYSREDVHDIFSPKTEFVPQAGTWGLQGVVPIAGRAGDYVFFVTFGQRQGAHTFEEGITRSGVFTWQSQPSQGLADKRVLEWIRHDPEENSIYLFLRTDSDRKYAYMGRLAYVSHDPSKEHPVYFTWRILNWNLGKGRRKQLNLQFIPEPTESRTQPIERASYRSASEAGTVEKIAKRATLGHSTLERAVEGVALATLPQFFGVSMRLENWLKRAYATGEISVETIGEYVADPRIEEKLLRSWGIGRKSVGELDRLVKAIVIAGSQATNVADLAQLLKLSPKTAERFIAMASSGGTLGSSPAIESQGSLDEQLGVETARICQLFRALPFPSCLATLPISVRLTNAFASFVEQHGSSLSLEDIFKDFPVWLYRLRRQANVGNTTITEFKRILCGFAIDILSRTDEFSERADEIGRQLCHLDPELQPTPVPKLPIVATPLTPEVLLKELLGRLPERKRKVLDRRFGLTGVSETLEQISTSYNVTRERIRQIESGALKDLRRQSADDVLASVLTYAADAWESISGQEGAVSQAVLQSRQRNLSPWFQLALSVADLSLEEFLNRYAHRFQGGWVYPGASIERLKQLRARFKSITKDVPLPQAIESLFSEGERRDAKAAAIVSGRRMYGSYLLTDRPTARVRRAANLHTFLSTKTELLQLSDLIEQYRQHFLNDPCSARDAAIVMEANRHLFAEIIEGVWVALGASGSVPGSSTQGAAPADDEQDAEHGERENDEPQTVAASIEAALRLSGPLRISEIIDRASSYLDPSKSINSIGPVLLVTKDIFARPLPGIYALHDQIPRREDLLRLRPAFIFQEEQVRIYTYARRAGEAWGSYPLWLPETEYLWCVWARQHAAPELLESFLSIVDVGAWPEVDGRNEWADLARERGKFSIAFAPRFDAVALPTLDEILAGCLFVQNQGRMSWISANRILQRRAIEHIGAGLLACLIRMGVLLPGEDWQANHLAGPAVHDVTSALVLARQQKGELSWETTLGRELIDRAKAGSVSGWLRSAQLPDLFGEGTGSQVVVDTRTALERLLDEREQSKRASTIETVANLLVGGQIGDAGETT